MPNLDFVHMFSPQHQPLPTQTPPDFPIDILRQQLKALGNDRQRPRPQRDLAKSALSLAQRFDVSKPTGIRVEREVLTIAMQSIQNNDRVEDIRERFENYKEGDRPADRAHKFAANYFRSHPPRSDQRQNASSHQPIAPSMQYSSSLDQLRGEVATICDSRQSPRSHRDLMKAVQNLSARFDERDTEQRGLIKNLLKLALQSTRKDSDSDVARMRNRLENLAEAENPWQGAHQIVRERLKVPVPVTDVIHPPNASTSRAPTQPAQTSYPDLRVFDLSKDTETIIQKDADDYRQYGYNVTVARHRENLPPGDYSVHDKRQGTKYTSYGKSNIHYGGSLFFE